MTFVADLPFAIPSHLRVLVVDDAPTLRGLLVRQLELAGHEVVGEADGPADALARLETLRPEVVLVSAHEGYAASIDACRTAHAFDARESDWMPGVLLCTTDAVSVWDAASGNGPSLVLRKPLSQPLFDRALRLAALWGRERTLERAIVTDRRREPVRVLPWRDVIPPELHP